jgi:hypothetical protein
MVMVGHNGIGADIECIHLSQGQHALLNPVTAVFVVVIGVLITATEKGTVHTPGGAVVVGCRFQSDLVFPSAKHGVST